MECMPGSEWQNFQNPAARASFLWTTSCRPGALGPDHRDARTHSVRLGLSTEMSFRQDCISVELCVFVICFAVLLRHFLVQMRCLEQCYHRTVEKYCPLK